MFVLTEIREGTVADIHIVISATQRDALIAMKRGKDKYEDVLQRLLDHYEATAKVEA